MSEVPHSGHHEDQMEVENTSLVGGPWDFPWRGGQESYSGETEGPGHVEGVQWVQSHPPKGACRSESRVTFEFIFPRKKTEGASSARKRSEASGPSTRSSVRDEGHRTLLDFQIPVLAQDGGRPEAPSDGTGRTSFGDLQFVNITVVYWPTYK